jgi:hypothetical protein
VPVLDAATLAAIGSAPIAVLAWCARDGAPRSCAVTPYVDAGDLVVTSTLAFPAKGSALRRDPRVSVLVGGRHLSGTAEVGIADVAWFDTHLRAQESDKFPPSRALFAVPGHRCLVPWYVQRIVIRVTAPTVAEVAGDDAVTVTSLGTTGLMIVPTTRPTDLAMDTIAVPGVSDGPADLLVHEEHADYAGLRQANRRGVVVGEVLTVATRSGSLAPGQTGTVAQLRELRALSRRARAERARIATWPRLAG